MICKIEKVVSSHLMQKCVSQQRWKDNAFSLQLQCLNSIKCFSFGALYGNFLDNITFRQFMSLERSKRRVLPEPRQELPEVTNARFVSSRSQSPTVFYLFICVFVCFYMSEEVTNARLVSLKIMTLQSTIVCLFGLFAQDLKGSDKERNTVGWGLVQGDGGPPLFVYLFDFVYLYVRMQES